MVGIVSYGTYIPKYRIRMSEIARVWKKDSKDIEKSLGIVEKSVPATDEDAVTLAWEAAQQSLTSFGRETSQIEALLVGSESHPYAVNPTSTIVAEFLGMTNNYFAADMEFACKAGTAAMISISGLIASGKINYGLTIGTDTAQGKPHDALEYTSAAGSAAFILGKSKIIANLIDFSSYSSDTPDFWRRDGVRYPSHAGRFTGVPAYFAHVAGAANVLLQKTKLKPADFDYCIFHMPNGKFPRTIAKTLGFSDKQLAPSLIVDAIGNPYSASSMLGLAAVLDIAKPKQKIFMVSYGSGAGSDAFVWKTTDRIVQSSKLKVRSKTRVEDFVSNKIYIDYPQYLRQTGKI